MANGLCSALTVSSEREDVDGDPNFFRAKMATHLSEDGGALQEIDF
jgi:hypothetical protein